MTSASARPFTAVSNTISSLGSFKSGRQRDAEAIFDKYLPLIRYENQPLINLTIRKAFLQRRGAIQNATPRPPFNPIDAGTQAEIDWLLKRMGIEDPTQRICL